MTSPSSQSRSKSCGGQLVTLSTSFHVSSMHLSNSNRSVRAMSKRGGDGNVNKGARERVEKISARRSSTKFCKCVHILMKEEFVFTAKERGQSLMDKGYLGFQHSMAGLFHVLLAFNLFLLSSFKDVICLVVSVIFSPLVPFPLYLIPWSRKSKTA